MGCSTVWAVSTRRSHAPKLKNVPETPRQTAWVNVTEAARILGSSKTRLGQISDKGPLPFETSKSGRRHRRYRLGRLCCVVRSRAMPRRDLGPVMVR